MIPVKQAPEPPDFDRKVRQPGLSAIAKLVGETPSRPRPGNKHQKLVTKREDIPAANFPPLWRKAQEDLLTAYRRLCAYLSLYIEHGTGAPTVDHMLPKSRRWDKTYEWSNYRLACALMNSRKGAAVSVLDPFEIADDWFALEFVEFQVKAGPGVTDEIADRVEETIEKLKLNSQSCCRARGEYVKEYLAQRINLDYLERRAPFIARELRHQGLLREGDAG